MNRRHALAIALILGVAAVLGLVAVTRTAKLGTNARAKSTQAIVTARTRQLNRFEASLRRELHARTPALPGLPPLPRPPKTPAVAVAAPAVAPQQASPQRVIYVRPKPIVHIVHRSHGDDGGDGERSAQGGGGDD